MIDDKYYWLPAPPLYEIHGPTKKNEWLCKRHADDPSSQNYLITILYKKYIFDITEEFAGHEVLEICKSKIDEMWIDKEYFDRYKREIDICELTLLELEFG